MDYKFDYEILNKAILNYGEISQKVMLFEEMAELQKEVCKEMRGNNNVLEIALETADVYIMLEQMKIMYGIDENIVQEIINAKINRLKERLESEEE